MPSPTDPTRRVADALRELQASIAEAPIHEIRDMMKEADKIGGEGGAETNEVKPPDDFHAIDEALSSLCERANLADKSAIKTLVFFGCEIADILRELASLSQEPELEELDQAGGRISDGWREKLEKALKTLCNTDEGALEESSKELVSRLPESEFLLPRELSGAGWRSDGVSNVPTEICERLIQRRLNHERRLSFVEVAADSLAWPIAVGVSDNNKTTKVEDLMGGLELGSSLNFPQRQRGSDSPSSFTFRIYRVFQAERENYTPHELDDLKKAIATVPGEQLSLLIRAAKNANGRCLGSRPITRVLRGGSIPEEHLALWIERIEKLNRHPGDVPTKIKVYLGGYQATETLESRWRLKAAVLPDLSHNTIESWAEAAWSYCAWLCRGDFEGYRWPSCLGRYDRKKFNSMTSAFENFLKRGFQTHCDRMNKEGSGQCD